VEIFSSLEVVEVVLVPLQIQTQVLVEEILEVEVQVEALVVLHAEALVVVHVEEAINL
jgi:hypothetical protein